MNDDLGPRLDDLLTALPPTSPLPQGVLDRGARRRRAKLGGGALGLVLAAGGAVALVDPGGSTDTLVPDYAASPSATASPVVSLAPAAPLQLVLEPGGLGYVRGPASLGHVSFADTSAEQARDLAERAFGPGTTSPLPDCGPAVVVATYRGITLYLDGPRWVGWSTTSRTLTTGDGVGAGTTLTELRAAFAEVAVTTATIGPEWSAGELSGQLTGTTPTSTVARVQSGQTCVFR